MRYTTIQLKAYNTIKETYINFRQQLGSKIFKFYFKSLNVIKNNYLNLLKNK